MHFLVYDESPHQLLCFAGQKDGLQPDVFNIFVALKRLKNSCLFIGDMPNTYFDSLILNPRLGEHVLNLVVLVVDNFLKASEIIISRCEQNWGCIGGELHKEFISEIYLWWLPPRNTERYFYLAITVMDSAILDET